MASREIRRSKERITKNKKEETSITKKLLPIPTLIIIGLVLFGLVFGLGSGSQQWFNFNELGFAEYDGHQIAWKPGNYFALKIGELMNRRAQYSEEAAFRAILPYMIFHTAVMIEAEKSGIMLSREEVEQYIKNSQITSRYNNATPAERVRMFNNIKEQATELKFLYTMFSLDTEQNTSLTDFIKQMGAYERKFRYVQWSYENYPASQIIQYAGENADQFKKIKLNRISTKEEAKAREALGKIRSSASSFEEQQAELQADAANAEATWQPYYRLLAVIGSKEAVDTIYTLKRGEVSEPVQVGSDWVIYKCEEESVAADLKDMAVIEEIKSYVYDYEKGRIQEYFEEKAREFKTRAEATSFAAAAREFGLKEYTTDYFPLNVNGLSFLKPLPQPVDEKASLSAAQSDIAFFTEAFSINKDEMTSPVLLSEKVAVLQFMEDRQVPEYELDKIGTDFTANMQQQANSFLQILQHVFHSPSQPLYYSPESFQQLPYYSLFVDSSKMGTPAEQDEQFQKALAVYQKALRGE